jgi:hypothetical protein
MKNNIQSYKKIDVTSIIENINISINDSKYQISSRGTVKSLVERLLKFYEAKL